jgi:hypothetical protein
MNGWTTEVPDLPPEERPKQTTPAIDHAIQQWQEADAALKSWKEREAELRWALAKLAFPTPVEGTNTLELGGGYQFKMVYGWNFTCENKKGETNAVCAELCEMGPEGVEVARTVFNYKPEVRSGAYRNVTDPRFKPILEKVVTSKLAMPTLSVTKAKL